jgi:hypothetical protein
MIKRGGQLRPFPQVDTSMGGSHGVGIRGDEPGMVEELAGSLEYRVAGRRGRSWHPRHR